MSYVEIFTIKKSGDVVSHSTTHNNHAFAPFVWVRLADKYDVPASGWGTHRFDPLWDLQGTGKLGRLDDILLGGTFNRVWVGREDVPTFIEACRAFHRDFVAGKDIEDTVNRVAGILATCMEPDDLGVAFNMCSANDSCWSVSVECDYLDSFTESEECYGCDEDCEHFDERSYNVLTDTAHQKLRVLPPLVLSPPQERLAAAVAEEGTDWAAWAALGVALGVPIP